MQHKEPQTGAIYRHFKNKLYQIITIAEHSESSERLVIYQALYGDFRTYARPLDMFLDEVDTYKYPDVKQKYRFEEVDRGTLQTETNPEPAEEKTPEYLERSIFSSEKQLESLTGDDLKAKKHEIVLSFLETESWEEKEQILYKSRKIMDNSMIDNMALALDIAVKEGPVEVRLSELIRCIKTFAKYDGSRLR